MILAARMQCEEVLRADRTNIQAKQLLSQILAVKPLRLSLRGVREQHIHLFARRWCRRFCGSSASER